MYLYLMREKERGKEREEESRKIFLLTTKLHISDAIRRAAESNEKILQDDKY